MWKCTYHPTGSLKRQFFGAVFVDPESMKVFTNVLVPGVRIIILLV